jgi:hypothetical protein
MRKKIQPRLNAAQLEREKRTIPPALAAHSWRPGQSGNPGGRTVEFADCQRLCREASAAAARRLIELMHSEDERVALMAADKVLERAWGRPKERDPATSLEQRLMQMTPDERAAHALDLADRIERRLAEAGVIIEHGPEEREE